VKTGAHLLLVSQIWIPISTSNRKRGEEEATELLGPKQLLIAYWSAKMDATLRRPIEKRVQTSFFFQH
jgi:hypothetical protein